MFGLIDSAAERRVTFVGETIWDEYHFVAPLRGKPSKETVLAVELLRSELFEGGVLAAKKHANDFCRASLVSGYQHIKKSRWVEESGRKLFEVQELGFERSLEVRDIPGCDVIAVCDFGHGLIDGTNIHDLCSRDEFLAVACQTNAANQGFNLITKYECADYIVIDEPEARLAAADRVSPIQDVIERLARGRCGQFVVTHGRHGAYGWDGEKVIHSPALAESVVDTMGAGDAFFAVTASMAPGAKMEDLLMIGNAAAALKCGVIGHRQSVTKDALIKFLGERQ